MEGICGLFSFDHRVSNSRSQIDKMTDALSDGEQLNSRVVSGGNWAMACCGWDEEHWRPMTWAFQDDQLSLVAIGDVFNFEQLAQDLGKELADKGAVLAALYRAHPKEWAAKIHGNFAALVFEKQKQRLVAAVDRLGIRPLVWLRRGETIYVASRIASIKTVVPDVEIDASAIYTFMHHDMIPAPMTIYKEMQKLEPGCELVAATHHFALNRYWDISSAPKVEAKTDDIADQVYAKLDEAVATMSNGIARPEQVGCFLSGGTDSSSICGLMSKQQLNPVDAFSIGFPENGYDEMYYARIAANEYGLNHHEFYTQPQDVLDALPKLVRSYDEPFGNSSIIPAYFCALKAKEHGIDYLLAGDGGDELFGGNERYSMQQVFRNYFKAPAFVRKGLLEPVILNRLEKLPLGIFRKAGSYIRRAKLSEVERIYSYTYVTDEEIFAPEFLTATAQESALHIPQEHFQRMDEAELLDRHLYLDMKMTISDNDLVKVTHMTECAGVRVRYPMLDQDVVDYAFRIPAKLKLAGTRHLRYIFKHAFRDLLPDEIIKKTKHGFGLPISIWLRDNPKIRQFAHDVLFDPAHLQRGYFRKEFVEKLWKLQLEDRTPYYGTVLWKMLILEMWHRMHVDGEQLTG